MTEENKELSLPEGLSKSKEELLEKLRHWRHAANVQGERAQGHRGANVQPEPREDKPKIRNRCGDCAAFHTHFCPFELTVEERAPILRKDYACSDFFPRLKLEVWHPRPVFDQVVENL